MKFKTDFPRYVADKFNERLEELGMSKYKFVHSNSDYTTHPTLNRILRGDGSSNMNTVAHYADLLGLEIIIRKKEEK